MFVRPLRDGSSGRRACAIQRLGGEFGSEVSVFLSCRFVLVAPPVRIRLWMLRHGQHFAKIPFRHFVEPTLCQRVQSTLDLLKFAAEPRRGHACDVDQETRREGLQDQVDVSECVRTNLFMVAGLESLMP